MKRNEGLMLSGDALLAFRALTFLKTTPAV
jgi:hypothetical protein